MIKLQFNFKLQSKDNEKIYNRAGRFFLSPKYKAYSEKIKWEAMSQYKGKPLTGDLSMVILAGFKEKRHPDCQNLPKSLCDSLEGIAYLNDRQIKKIECVVLEKEPRDSFIVTIEIYGRHWGEGMRLFLCFYCLYYKIYRRFCRMNLPQSRKKMKCKYYKEFSITPQGGQGEC